MIVHRVLADGADAIERVTVNDLAARGLLETSFGADLLVVGARGLGSFRGLLLGSVSQVCLHHARIPVAVVRTPRAARPAGPERIVVGVDGSDTSQRALDWALDEARLRQAAVDVVHAWHPPLPTEPTLADSYRPFEDAARSVLDGAVEQADTGGLPVPVRRTLRTGSGGHVLVDEAKHADLVVVGSRGLGGEDWFPTATSFDADRVLRRKQDRDDIGTCWLQPLPPGRSLAALAADAGICVEAEQRAEEHHHDERDEQVAAADHVADYGPYAAANAAPRHLGRRGWAGPVSGAGSVVTGRR